MKTNLPYLSREDNRHGKECLFVRRHGRRIRIREQEGTPAFAKAYSDALDALERPVEAGERARKEAAKAGTMGWLAARYFAESEEYKKLYDKSQQARRSCIEDCLREPRVPGSTDLIRDCIKSIQIASGGFHTWTVGEVEQYLERHPISTKGCLALALMLYLGARRQDAVDFGKQHIRNGWFCYVPKKTLYKRRDVSQKPFLPVLADIISRSPCGSLTFLETAYGKPFTANGFGGWFRDRCDEAGLPHCSAHGLKKAGATLAAENGATASQLMAIFDWSTISQAEVYTKAANRKRMAGDAMGFINLDQSENETLSHLPVALLQVSEKK
jgi:integrase